MTRAGTKRRKRLTAIAALLCALVASLAVVVAPAAAETGDSAPVRPMSDGGFDFPDITGPTAPEEYPFLLNPVSPEMRLRQVSDQEIVAEYIEGGVIGYSFEAVLAHDAVGATVPTTVQLSEGAEGPVVTLVVHHRAGNPAAGGAPFAYPIEDGPGWEGGWRTISVELSEPKPPVSTEPTPASPPAPTPICTVPSLRGVSLHAAKSRLRAADCGVGKVRLAAGSTAGKGKVVKQFRPAGTQLAAGAPVALKLGAPPAKS
jgi:PASTA domain